MKLFINSLLQVKKSADYKFTTVYLQIAAYMYSFSP